MADRIVITHDTDTITISAPALADMLGKTIVLVGALTPARVSESHAVFKLGMAFAAAQVAPPSVYITMFAAGQVVKDREHTAFVARRCEAAREP